MNHREAVICGKRVNRGVGMGLEIPVLYKLYGEHKYLTFVFVIFVDRNDDERNLQRQSTFLFY